jgi:2-(1,2-epoxy-1,2-dihydrophenyl)acetyl-CoA isomerase
MSYQNILFESGGGIARITLNRPDRLNSFTDAMHADLRDALAKVKADAALRALLLTGAGRGFCAGQDLSEREVPEGMEPVDIGATIERNYKPLVLTLQALPMPVVCAVNGVAAGAGLGIALAADFRIASDSARFIAAQIRTARVPDAGLTYFLPRMVGIERALGIALTGRTVTAAEALSLGLVGEVVPGERLMARALSLADELARGPALAMRLTREAISKGADSSLEQALEREHAALIEASAHPDVEEGTRAFLEKREPRFA